MERTGLQLELASEACCHFLSNVAGAELFGTSDLNPMFDSMPAHMHQKL